MREVETKGYCVGCKAKRLMQHPQNITLNNGRSAHKGHCIICSTQMITLVRYQTTQAQAHLG